jgi:hypothetical protein
MSNLSDQVEHDTFGWVTGYSANAYAMSPDAGEEWADGFRDAHIHVLIGDKFYAGTWLKEQAPDYQHGYLAGISAIVAGLRAEL